MLSTSAFAGVIVSEIVYDAPSGDGGSEWIELFNTSDAAIDIGDWTIQQGTTISVPVPAETSIGARQAVVVHLQPSTGARTRETVLTFWGAPLVIDQILVLTGSPSLTHSAAALPNSLKLLNSAGEVQDEVAYENGSNNWPAVATNAGRSIYLVGDLTATGNDMGANWKLATLDDGVLTGADGVFRSAQADLTGGQSDATLRINGPQVGSPGVVLIPEPAVLGALASGFLLLGRRGRR